MNVLADLMRETAMPSFMAPPDTSQIPHFPNSSHLVASTPANLPGSNTHFQFSDLDIPPTNTSTRPPSNGSSNNSRPPSKQLDLSEMMKFTSAPQPGAHFQIADNPGPVISETRQPAASSDNIPSSVIPNLSTSNRSSPTATV